MTYGIVFMMTLMLFVITFFIAKRHRKHDYLDIIWGVGFTVSAVSSYLIGNSKSMVGLVMTGLVTIWGIRLTVHLAKRNIGQPEDYRYQAIRQKNGQQSEWVIFFRMYLLQYMLNLLIGFVVIYVNINGSRTWSLISWSGLLFWVIGFGFEAIGDGQLRRFKLDSTNQGKLMTKGLWRYTRHPNYFGEAMQWWALYLMSLTSPSYWFLFFSPLIIHLFLLYVSGVPLLEKKYEGRFDWEIYKQQTSRFIPLPPKKVKVNEGQ